MTSIPAPLSDSPAFEPTKQARLWDRAEVLLERGSEWLNPILVKEARQALKSRQFVWTMVLLLVGTLGWTMIGIASQIPGLYFYPAGMTLLTEARAACPEAVGYLKAGGAK